MIRAPCREQFLSRAYVTPSVSTPSDWLAWVSNAAVNAATLPAALPHSFVVAVGVAASPAPCKLREAQVARAMRTTLCLFAVLAALAEVAAHGAQPLQHAPTAAATAARVWPRILPSASPPHGRALHEAAATVRLQFEWQGEPLTLALRRNDALFSPDYEERLLDGAGAPLPGPLLPVPACFFQGTVEQSKGSVVAVSLCDGVRGIVKVRDPAGTASVSADWRNLAAESR